MSNPETRDDEPQRNVTNTSAESVKPVHSTESTAVGRRLAESWFAVCLSALLLVTGPLWVGSEHFPRVPFATCLAGGGSVVDIGLLVPLAACLVGLLARRNICWIGILVAFGGLVVRDQNRLQPWVWHAMLVSAVSIGTARRDNDWMRSVLWITVSIYGWSAVSKADTSFVHSYGQQLVDALFGAIGLSTRWWSPSAKLFAAAVLPLGELLVAVLMMIPRTRRAGCFLSILMHVGLMLAVGPLGLNHLPGVIWWNVYFIGQNGLIGWMTRSEQQMRPGRSGSRETSVCDARIRTITSSATGEFHLSFAFVLRRFVLIGVLVWPALRSWNWCDNWPSWAVYAAGIEHVSIHVHRSALSRVPDDLRPFVETVALQTDWRTVRVDRWALARCHAPIYPEDRYSIALALWLTEQAKFSDEELRVVWRGPANRLTGEREVIECRGQSGLKEFAARYWLNLQTVRN